MSIQISEPELNVNGRIVKTYLAQPENGGPGILLLHAWWGLKPFFKLVCDRLAGQGFTTFAPDLRNGEIAKTVDEAKALMEKSDERFTSDIANSAGSYLLGLPGRKGKKIGVIGFSMGGNLALNVAASMPGQVAATVLVYGAGEADFAKIKSKVIGHFSDVDEWEQFDYVKLMESKLKAAGVDVQIYEYPGKAHWFVEEDRPEYDPEAAALLWDRTYGFLKRYL